MLFAEQMLKRMLHNHHGEFHIVLPFDKNDFYTTSVDFGQPEQSAWRERCDRILAHKDVQVHYATTEKFLGDDVLFDFANTVAQGLAITHAAQLGVEPYALVVRDPSSKQEPIGGTAYFLRVWKGGRRKARVIDLAALRSKVQLKAHGTAKHTRPSAPIVTEETIKRQVKAMIFADVKNFSKLNEEQTPLFMTKFLNGVAELIEPLKKETRLPSVIPGVTGSIWSFTRSLIAPIVRSGCWTGLSRPIWPAWDCLSIPRSAWGFIVGQSFLDGQDHQAQKFLWEPCQPRRAD